MFTTTQQLWLKVAVAAAIIFFLALIGGANFVAAAIWGLLVALVLFLVLRQNARVAGDEDMMPAIAPGRIDQARSYVSNRLSDAEKTVAPEPSEERRSEMSKPDLLDSPREGGADDLKRISGVGPKLEKSLHNLGVYHFDQIAGWTEKELAWVDDSLDAFKGRAIRDNWVEQAKALTATN